MEGIEFNFCINDGKDDGGNVTCSWPLHKRKYVQFLNTYDREMLQEAESESSKWKCFECMVVTTLHIERIVKL